MAMDNNHRNCTDEKRVELKKDPSEISDFKEHVKEGVKSKVKSIMQKGRNKIR